MTKQVLWTEGQLCDAFVAQAQLPWAVKIRTELLDTLTRALEDAGFKCGGDVDDHVRGEVDTEWLNVTARSLTLLDDPLGLAPDRRLQAEAAIELLGQFADDAEVEARRRKPVHLTVRLSLIISFVTPSGEPFTPTSRAEDPLVLGLVQFGWDKQAPEISTLTAWVEETLSGVAQAYEATLPESVKNLVGELQDALAP